MEVFLSRCVNNSLYTIQIRPVFRLIFTLLYRQSVCVEYVFVPRYRNSISQYFLCVKFRVRKNGKISVVKRLLRVISCRSSSNSFLILEVIIISKSLHKLKLLHLGHCPVDKKNCQMSIKFSAHYVITSNSEKKRYEMSSYSLMTN